MTKALKKIIVLLFLTGAFIFSAFQNETNIVSWNENRPLTWNDFKGKPEPRFAAATTSYDILKSVTKLDKNTAQVELEAVFFKNSSWKKVKWINEEVLQHEQKHFDIAELFARKLRKKISALTFKNFEDLESKLTALYEVNDKEMDQYQDLYDEETDGSMNGEQQRAWQKKILAEIKQLDDFKDTKLLVHF
jgi:hypothetical protein